ncbi:MAG: bifunctional diaminohydroxyphosphoribosylaminopyrimidine deaminase/5-amino-6-(5-phosphoribosylamino)uracil reductase RibD [Campylobacteraceae bacterium]|nr:bifunctional diaminohydroxyphosphoribosylaminopyrimidine deaminase/5-amino-6-(5-phosphoribosylamino)uracil reductase RibD [Campylobacteraceae bacterium]
MNIAVKEAWKYQGLTYPNPAVGALVCDDFGSILSCKAHTKAGNPHAEVEVIKDAFIKLTNDKNLTLLSSSQDIHNYLIRNHNNIFNNFIIYVTLEPCNHHGRTPPCSYLIKELGFKKVVIGKQELNKKASGGVEFLRRNGIQVEILQNDTSCKNLLLPFTKWQEKNFVFFKLAMSQNGVINGGVITSEDSRKLVHNFRNVCDLLVIGGNTARVDRPILDARKCNGKAPDVLIYSKKDNLDKEIPLFKVENRKVFIANNFDILKDYKNVMIEGGEGMLKATKEIVDMYAIFHSPNFKIGKHPDLNLNLNLLNLQKIKEDTLSWLNHI